jgi:hypothetical protein
MSEIRHIVSAEPVIHGVVKIVWDDNYEGVVDLRPIIARGKIFTCLQDAGYFNTVRVASYGHSIYWGEEDNEAVDFGCDRLREIAEEQAARVAQADRDR